MSRLSTALTMVGMMPVWCAAAQAEGEVPASHRAAHRAGPVRHASTAKPGPVMARQTTAVDVSARRHDFAYQEAQHIPDATTRITAERLTERGVVTLRGLERVAPNLTIQSINGTASTNFYLRGVGFNDFTQNNMAPVLTYVDDVAFPYSSMTSGMMFDLAGASVTPGPVARNTGSPTQAGKCICTPMTPRTHGILARRRILPPTPAAAARRMCPARWRVG